MIFSPSLVPSYPHFFVSYSFVFTSAESALLRTSRLELLIRVAQQNSEDLIYLVEGTATRSDFHELRAETQSLSNSSVITCQSLYQRQIPPEITCFECSLNAQVMISLSHLTTSGKLLDIIFTSCHCAIIYLILLLWPTSHSPPTGHFQQVSSTVLSVYRVLYLAGSPIISSFRISKHFDNFFIDKIVFNIYS